MMLLIHRDISHHITSQHKGKKLPSVRVLGDFIFREIVWPARLSKSDSMLSQSEGQLLLDIMDDHGLEQMIPFPTPDKNTLDLILNSLPGQFQHIHSSLVISTLFQNLHSTYKRTSEESVFISYQKGDFETMRKDALRFAKEKYFNGHSEARSVQENFNLIIHS